MCDNRESETVWVAATGEIRKDIEMATLTITAGKTPGYNIQWYEDKDNGTTRKTIYLGGRRYSKKTAERFKEIVETLLYYRRNGISVPDKRTEQWLTSAPIELKAKLAKAGLLAQPKSLNQLWDAFLRSKTDVKQATLDKYEECRKLFFETFGMTAPVTSLTPDGLLEWKITLADAYAEATVAGYIKNAKAVLNWAVKQDWIAKNPMQDIPRGSFRNKDKDRFITIDEYRKLLNACPNQEWRTIISLARIGGLRCPSELKQLRWSDINWEGNRFLVKSPKTERHEEHKERLVPLFTELRTELLATQKKGEFVIQGLQDTTWILNPPFQAIATQAGFESIPAPFVNMRRSRSNEVAREYGDAKESMWIGHSVDVMEKRYRQQLDEDFVV